MKQTVSLAVATAILAGTLPVGAQSDFAKLLETVQITDSNEVYNAHVNGGEYILANDIELANSGLNGDVTTTGIIDGAMFTVKKTNELLGDALLYMNNDSAWTYKNMILDGGMNDGVRFSDACMWYMAGSVVFSNVTLQNFGGNSAERFTMTNAGSDITLRNVEFKGNENTVQTVFDTNPGLNTIWGGGTTHLEGSTKVNMYYCGGAVDVEKLSEGCNVVIKANDENNYNAISAMSVANSTVVKTEEPENLTVSFISKDEPNPNITDEPITTENPDVTDEPTNPENPKMLAYNFDTDEDIVEPLLKNGATIEKDGGINGNGLYLDGASGYMQLPDNIISDDMTFMAWVRQDNDAEYARVFDFGTDTENYVFFAPKKGMAEARIKGVGPSAWFEPMLTTGEWTHLALVKSDNTVKIYRNGKLETEQNFDVELSKISQTTNYIGKSHYDWDPNFGGAMDEIYLYNSVLSEEDIVAEYNKYSGNITSKNALSDFKAISLPSEITTETILPIKGALGSTIEWTSSEVGIINSDMSLNIPNEGEADRRVTLGVKVTNGTSEYSKDFDVVLLAKPTLKNAEDYSMSSVELTDEYLKNGTEKMNDYLGQFDLDRLMVNIRTNADVNGGNYKLLAVKNDDNSGVKVTLQGLSAENGEADLYVAAYDENGRLLSVNKKDIKLDISSGQNVDFNCQITDNATVFLWENNTNEPICEVVSVLESEPTYNLDAQSYGGWESSLISGHTVGHYLSAVSQSGANGNAELLEMSKNLVSALNDAQIKRDGVISAQRRNGDTMTFDVREGYIFAAARVGDWVGDVDENGIKIAGDPVYGEKQFDNLKENKGSIITQAWVPWYTMHKILAGLIDAYKLTGNDEALETASKLGTWVYNRVGDYDTVITDTGETMQQRILNVEYGGMNDCLYELYKITGDPNHAKAAHMFDEITLFDSLYADEDVLANKHANTTIPKILGALNRYRANESTNGGVERDAADEEHSMDYYLTVAKNFWDMVVNDHSYITGGNSENEHFRTPHTENAYRNNVNCETCNTYNMLKLSKELYKITGDKKYADYYEETFLNAIVSSQNPETGMTMYFQPMASGYNKVFSDPWTDFWCCTGSGMESMTKLNDSIYYKRDNTVIVNQYVSSVLTDEDNNLKLTQKSQLPDGDTSTMEIEPIAGEKVNATLMLRIPEWAATHPSITVNGETVEYTQSAGYASITKEWKKGDIVSITIPMEIRAYGLPDSATVIGFKYGPTVLSVGMGTENVDKYESHGMSVHKPVAISSMNEYVVIDPDYGTREEWLENINENMVKTDGKLEFTMKNTDQELVFTPHYRQYKERYGIYWYITGMSEEELAQTVLADKTAARDKNIVIDSIEPSHDQQENGHGYSQYNSIMAEGTAEMTNYRKIYEGGYIDYQMKIDKSKKNYLEVNLWSDDGGKKMSVYVGNIKLADIEASGEKQTLKYELSNEMLNTAYIAGDDAATITGNEAVHVVFKADNGTDSPKICGEVRVITDYGTNASLASLDVEGGTLTPNFSSDITEYTLKPEGDSIKLNVTPEDKYGLVYVNGLLINDLAAKKVSVKDTEKIEIIVKAEDHITEATYTISVKH